VAARVLVVDDSSTIRKVVSTILARLEFEPVSAESGSEGLLRLRQEPIDLILLDFLMPQMNGYQFCRELRADPKTHDLPVVLMSARADKIRDQFMRQTGAIDAITKPFDARGLVAVVEGALRKIKEGRGRAVPDASDMPEADGDMPRDSVLPGKLSVIPGAPGRIRVARDLARALQGSAVPELERLGDLPVAGSAFARAVSDALPPEAAQALKTLARTLEFGEKHQEVLSGDLSVISIAEVLQMLQMQQQSGALILTHRRAQVTLYVGKGNLQYAACQGLASEYLLGRYLIASGAVRRRELDGVLLSRGGSEALLGEALVASGHANPEQVRGALVQQSSELIYEIVRWKTGRFRFLTGVESSIAKRASLNLAISSLIMEGFRRVDEWQLIEGSIDFNAVLRQDREAIEAVDTSTKLTTKENDVLRAIDGSRTVREIVDQMGGSSFDVCKILYQFVNSRLVRRRVA
jgi:CheY-like chemotaxis protein